MTRLPIKEGGHWALGHWALGTGSACTSGTQKGAPYNHGLPISTMTDPAKDRTRIVPGYI